MTTPITTRQNAEDLERWILGRKKELSHVDHDHDLIENRVIDSLAFVEFVLYVEERSGREIPLDRIDIEDFRSIDAIVAKYFDR